ncbi:MULTISPECIES: HAMP domain-containing sensor histidine kinase [unclassified Frigoribacterium]|uniref:sensor histidine kinase n=1 Tax=unclassified Frigoribacterium TaxID=2627005 RepID=UPI0006FEBF7E|nr:MULTISPECIES: HAMP domain-containing sensor histidine kinase [unclassified Frigoribacterium]KQO48387.1 histidine kinase [Frigoribacterium sp. Leaf254]KQT40600.1 histidine kinase [Frigoribacterium sp. Leaf415]
MGRTRGPSVRLRLALSYAAVVVVTGVLLLGVVWLFLLRYVPQESLSGVSAGFVPNRGDLTRAFLPRAVGALVVLLAVGLLGGWLLAGRLLAPLDRMTGAARRAAEGSLSHRIALPGRADEFRELADAFDTMLERLEAHVSAQRRFAANASHELRTPLAISRTLLEVAHDDPAADARVLAGRLREVNDRAIDLTEALLVLSRADQRSFDRSPVDLSLLADEAVELLAPLADARGVALEVEGEVTPTTGSSALLRQVVTNLVHNGIVHNVLAGTAERAGSGVTDSAGSAPEVGSVVGRSAPEVGSVVGRSAAWVSVAAAPQGGGAVLVVENSGPVVSPSLVATLVEPFQRGDARVRGDHQGSGLGLAIVDAIVRAHDGTLEVRPRVGGGLRVTVELHAFSG